MALINGAQAQTATGSTGGTTGGASKEDLKAKKLEALARFKEKRAAKAVEEFKNACALRDELVKAQVFDKLTPATKQYLLDQCKDPSVKSALGSGPSVFSKLFGESAKVNDKITLEDVWHKVARDGKYVRLYMKRWADKGIVVEEVPNKDIFKTEYVIKSISAGAVAE